MPTLTSTCAFAGAVVVATHAASAANMVMIDRFISMSASDLYQCHIDFSQIW